MDPAVPRRPPRSSRAPHIDLTRGAGCECTGNFLMEEFSFRYVECRSGYCFLLHVMTGRLYVISTRDDGYKQHRLQARKDDVVTGAHAPPRSQDCVRARVF